LNLPKISPSIRLRRNSRARLPFFAEACAAALASAILFAGALSTSAQSLNGIGMPGAATLLTSSLNARSQKQKQAPPPPPPVTGPGAPQARIMRPVTPQVNIEPSEQLFTTMCALWAAGYFNGTGTDDLPNAWKSVADEMQRHVGPATDELHQYLESHQNADRNATLSKFISLGLLTDSPPDFRYTLKHEELPPDVLTIEEFNVLLAKFYKEAQVQGAWSRVEPSYANGIAQLQGPMTQIVQKTMGYLREVFKSDSRRTFTVYVEPLAGVSTNFRTYGDAYAIVLDGNNISLTEIRHAFLHFLLDPLPIKYGNAVLRAKPVFLAAAAAPRMPREYRDDLTGFYTECLIKAVEIQLDHLTPGQREHAMDEADAEGFVLVRPLAAQLVKFQQDDPAMSYYFGDLAGGVDIAAELKRVQAIQFPPVQGAPPISAEAADAAKRDQMLQQGERLLTAQDGKGAQEVFEQVLQRWPGTPRATYGLAIAAVYQKQKDRAKELFATLTRSAANGAGSDPVILAWSHIYLGRINDGECSREKAVAEYRAAMAVQGAPERARQAAQSGIDKPYVPPGQPGNRPCEAGNP
jgi:hypothetical protein